MTDWGARTRQMGTFPVDLENIRVFAGGFGNRLFTLKSGFPKFSLFHLAPGQPAGQKKQSICKKGFPKPLSKNSYDCPSFHLRRMDGKPIVNTDDLKIILSY